MELSICREEAKRLANMAYIMEIAFTHGHIASKDVAPAMFLYAEMVDRHVHNLEILGGAK